VHDGHRLAVMKKDDVDNDDDELGRNVRMAVGEVGDDVEIRSSSPDASQHDEMLSLPL
jgi:hypothetical protein